MRLGTTPSVQRRRGGVMLNTSRTYLNSTERHDQIHLLSVVRSLKENLIQKREKIIDKEKKEACIQQLSLLKSCPNINKSLTDKLPKTYKRLLSLPSKYLSKE